MKTRYSKRLFLSVFLLCLLLKKDSFAGPPFATDDPVPVDYKHTEIYFASTYTRDKGGSSGSLPMLDMNYGICPEVHAHVTTPFNFNTNVALVKYYPGLDPKIIDHIISSGYKAIIFEGTGLGHVGKVMYEYIEKAKKKGLFLGMTSQCIDGTVRMTVYESGRDLLNLGMTPLGNMIPETALVKAMWALGNSKTIEEMEKMMKENIAMEFSD